MKSDLIEYYSQRANEYDKVYSIPEEQNDLRSAAELFKNIFANRKVIEIACGTGYWTEQVSKTATKVLATDINESVLEIARERARCGNVVFEKADMWELQVPPLYDAMLGGFIWSHIKLENLDAFLSRLRDYLMPGAVVAFIDSRPVGKTHHNKNIIKTDQEGNTYQRRSLDDGSTHLVLKNFPDREFIERKLKPFAARINYVELDNYWIVYYELAG